MSDSPGSDMPPTTYLPGQESRQPDSPTPPTAALPPRAPAPMGNPFAGDDKPERLGPYLLREQIGQGGMGVVYRAHDEHLDRAVAIKIIVPEYAASEMAVARLKAEAQAVARLSHSHIVSVYAFGEE